MMVALGPADTLSTKISCKPSIFRFSRHRRAFLESSAAHRDRELSASGPESVHLGLHEGCVRSCACACVCVCVELLFLKRLSLVIELLCIFAFLQYDMKTD